MRSEQEPIVCIMGEGMKKCLPVRSLFLRDSSIVLTVAKWITIAFISILGIVTVLALVSPIVNVEAALSLTGAVMLYPASIFGAMLIGYMVWKALGKDGNTNTALVLVVLAIAGVGIYFLWAWLNVLIADIWATIILPGP